MKSLKLNQIKFVLIAICFGVSSASADPVGASGVLDPSNLCSITNWQITGAIKSSDYAGSVTALPVAISSTSCAGVYTGNDGPALNPSPNRRASR